MAMNKAANQQWPPTSTQGEGHSLNGDNRYSSSDDDDDDDERHEGCRKYTVFSK